MKRKFDLVMSAAQVRPAPRSKQHNLSDYVKEAQREALRSPYPSPACKHSRSHEHGSHVAGVVNSWT